VNTPHTYHKSYGKNNVEHETGVAKPQKNIEKRRRRTYSGYKCDKETIMVLRLILAGALAVGAGTGGGAIRGIGVDAPAPSFRAGAFELSLQDRAKGLLGLRIDGWEAFSLGGLRPSVTLDGTKVSAGRCRFDQAKESLRVVYDFPGRARLVLSFSPAENGGLRLRSELRNTSGRTIVFNAVDLLATRRRRSRCHPSRGAVGIPTGWA
jgi:hypothetical protein